MKKLLAVMVLATTLCGCGTFKNLTGSAKPPPVPVVKALTPADISTLKAKAAAMAKTNETLSITPPAPVPLEIKKQGIFQKAQSTPKTVVPVIKVRMEKVWSSEAGSFGFNYIAESPYPGLVYFKTAKGLAGEDIWFAPYNATYVNGVATSYAPSVVRGGQPPTGKYVQEIVGEFRGWMPATTTSGPMLTTAKTVTKSQQQTFEDNKKTLGKDANRFGMTPAGTTILLPWADLK